MEIALAISILSAVMTVANFAVNRRDKAVKDTKENHQELIEYRLNQLEKKIDQVLTKLDDYDQEIDNRIAREMEQHIRLYHSKGE